MKHWVILPGRIFYSLIFIVASFNHFSTKTVAYAASHGVPMASLLVPLSGVLALLGGISILLGYKARWGAGML
ncbi:MAG: DoxX family protein, partial [Candidatus Omnitrophica bacterium]|nr:DoxX family protein [Candidatus Omnitrophota bacterium]